MGGLGNQMFQYATGRRLSLVRGVPLKLDVSSYADDRFGRSYRLDNFNIVADVATPAEIATLSGRVRKGRQGRLYRVAQRHLPFRWRRYIEEVRHGYSPGVMNASSNVYIDGYWQCDQYFSDMRETLQQELTLRWQLNESSHLILKQIEMRESVSLHVRRKDYVTISSVEERLGPCPIEYYTDAVRILEASIKAPHFYIFSDDIEWVKQNLKLDYPVTYMDHNGADRDYEDMHLMSLCKHHIIANSSFSWWGAWLSKNPGKVVIAPRRWFKNMNSESIDLVPKSWIRV
jgi:hypothetical protein